MTSTRLVEHLESALNQGPFPEPLRSALLLVDRARFVRPCDVAFAYEDRPLPLDTTLGRARPVRELLDEHGSWSAALASADFTVSGSTISAPMIYALALYFLDVQPGHRVLELGSGSGYGAALLAAMVGADGGVASVEVDPLLVETARVNLTETPNVSLLQSDGLQRNDLVAAHARIWITFSVEEPPRVLLDHLRESAVMLVPVGSPPPAHQRWMRFRREGGKLLEEELPVPVTFIPARALVSPG